MSKVITAFVLAGIAAWTAYEIRRQLREHRAREALRRQVRAERLLTKWRERGIL